jgi:single-strand DNA-binding protein
MSGSVNRVILIGHLGQDPKIDTLTSGGKVARFSLATSEAWRDKQTGERKQSTEWHDVVIFAEPLIEMVGRRLKKGSKVYVEGQNKTRKWTGRDNVERRTTEVVIKAYRGQLVHLDRAEQAPRPSEDDYGTTSTSTPAATATAEFDDDIPF